MSCVVSSANVAIAEYCRSSSAVSVCSSDGAIARLLNVRSPAVIEIGAHSRARSEEHTSELQSLMRISYAVFCLKKQTSTKQPTRTTYKQLSLPTHGNKYSI